MTDHTTETARDFDGCNRACRKAGKHTLRWGGCERAPRSEPTVSMSKVYTDTDGYPSIGYDSYTVPELADLIEPALRRVHARLGPNALAMLHRGETVSLSGGEYADLAREAAHAVVHRNDPAAPAVVPSADRAALRERLVAAIKASPFEELRTVDWSPNGPLQITVRVDDLADALLRRGLAVLPALAGRAAGLSSFVLWLDASDGSVPTHDGVCWPDGTVTIHHRHFGLTTTHHDPEAACRAAHGKQSRIVWPEAAPADRAAVLTEASDEETDVDVVATRAAQVITSMGAEIRALTGQRDRYRSAWTSARERAQAYGEGILRVVEDREAYQQWLKQAETQNAALLRRLAGEAAPDNTETPSVVFGRQMIERMADRVSGPDAADWNSPEDAVYDRPRDGYEVTTGHLVTCLAVAGGAADPDCCGQKPAETVHACPPAGSGVTPCCGRTPFELPRTGPTHAEGEA